MAHRLSDEGNLRWGRGPQVYRGSHPPFDYQLLQQMSRWASLASELALASLHYGGASDDLTPDSGASNSYVPGGYGIGVTGTSS